MINRFMTLAILGFFFFGMLPSANAQESPTRGTFQVDRTLRMAPSPGVLTQPYNTKIIYVRDCENDSAGSGVAPPSNLFRIEKNTLEDGSQVETLIPINPRARRIVQKGLPTPAQNQMLLQDGIGLPDESVQCVSSSCDDSCFIGSTGGRYDCGCSGKGSCGWEFILEEPSTDS